MKFAILIAIAAIATLWWNLTSTAIPPLCLRPDKCSYTNEPHCLFSDSYWESRERFRFEVQVLNGTNIPLEVVDGLTMDVGIINEENCGNSALVVLSGTHGVEGYAGGAVQLGLLRSLPKHKDNKQCIVLVHALNPFGWAMLRRWNENGVDLNRNTLFTQKEWDEVLQRDPNIAGYIDLSDAFNPTEPPSVFGMLEFAIEVLKHGMKKVMNVLFFGTVSLTRLALVETRSRNGYLPLQPMPILWRPGIAELPHLVEQAFS